MLVGIFKMNVLRYCIVAFVAGMAMGVAVEAEEAVKLASGGKSSYVILVSAKAGGVERFAANELQSYLKKITGAELPIVENPKDLPFIAVGDCSQTKNTAVMARYDDDDTWLIKTDNGNLILKGANPRGTLFSIYAFLEQMGCWWFTPATDALKEYCEYIPSISELIIKPTHDLVQPMMKYRKKDGGGRSNYKGEAWALLIDWMAKNRCNSLALLTEAYEADREIIRKELTKRGLMLEVGKHRTMREFLPQEKYFKDHPEWFGMLDGKRSQSTQVVFETANTKAVEEFEKNLISYLKNRPEIDVYQLWPPDSCKWSQSPESLALGSPSERMALLAQRVLKSVKAAGIKTRISYIAYQGTIEPPENMSFDKDALVEFCPINQDYSKPLDDPTSKINSVLNAALGKWAERFPGELTHYSYYVKASWASLPVVIPEQIAHEVKYWRKVGECGTDIYSQSRNWLAFEANHLSMARASWDAAFDGTKWFKEYLNVRFGNAAEPMKRYYGAAARVSLLGIIKHGKNESVENCKAMLPKVRKAMKEALTQADTPMAEWVVNKLSWEPDYLAAALDLRSAEIMGKPKPDIDALKSKINALLNSHRGDGTTTGELK